MKQLSVIATNASRAILPQLPSQPQEMLSRRPTENEATVRSLLRECGLQVRFTHAGGSLTAESVSLVPTPSTNWQQCSVLIAGLMAPAPEEKLLQWLTTMGVLVAKKEQGETVSELELIAYARKLRNWPGDVVYEVLDRYPDDNKWWPEWRDLFVQLKARSHARMLLAGTYRKWLEAPEFMARRGGLTQPEDIVKALPAPVRDQKVERQIVEDTLSDLTPEERARKMHAMKAAILKGEGA